MRRQHRRFRPARQSSFVLFSPVPELGCSRPQVPAMSLRGRTESPGESARTLRRTGNLRIRCDESRDPPASCLSARWEWIVAVGVTLANAAILSVNVQLSSLLPSDLTRCLDSFTLGVKAPRYPIGTALANRPLSVAWNHMLCLSTHSPTLPSTVVNHVVVMHTTSALQGLRNRTPSGRPAARPTPGNARAALALIDKRGARCQSPLRLRGANAPASPRLTGSLLALSFHAFPSGPCWVAGNAAHWRARCCVFR